VLLKLYSFSLENCKCTVGDIKKPRSDALFDYDLGYETLYMTVIGLEKKML